jgi:hypothetical protein
MDYIFSMHSLEQMKHRNISKETVLSILRNPDEIKIENGKKIYQSVVTEVEKKYLFRIFVNIQNRPNKIITVYKTSNIKKYYEGKI